MPRKLLIRTFAVLLLMCPAMASAGPTVVQQPAATLKDTIGSLKFGNLREKYDGREFHYIEKTAGQNFMDRFSEWITSVLRSIFGNTDGKNMGAIVETVFNVIAVVLVLLVVYLIAKALLNKEGRWIFGKNSDRRLISYDEIEKHIHKVDFEQLIRETVSSGQQRLAIRYYYLWLLKRMSDKHIIEWDAEKTNSDYVNEISNPALKEDFNYLSYLYNYIWYGGFEVNDQAFTAAAERYKQTLRKL